MPPYNQHNMLGIFFRRLVFVFLVSDMESQSQFNSPAQTLFHESCLYLWVLTEILAIVRNKPKVFIVEDPYFALFVDG